jgi:hypothetical protein
MSSGAPQPDAQPLPFAPLGTRIRKPIDYVRHYHPDVRAILESGDLILVLPELDFGFYLVKPDSMPEYLPEKTVNLATRWGTPIPKLTSAGSPSPIDVLVKAFDVGRQEIGHYRIAIFDPGVNVQFAQPAAKYRFNDKAGARRINYSNTMYHMVRHEWGAVIEAWLFQDNTPFQFTVTSSQMNEDTFWARVIGIGYKYQLLRVKPPDPTNEPRVVITVNVGEKQY